MRIKRMPVKKITSALVLAKKGEVEIEINTLVTHHKAGGNIMNVVMGLIAAKTAHVNLSVEEACSEDLKGVDIYERIKDIAANRK